MSIQRQNIYLALLFTGLFLFFPPGLSAHEGEDHADEIAESAGRVLGRISFPTTTESPEAQQAFVDGMLLLHLFEYPFARDEFLKAQQLDP